VQQIAAVIGERKQLFDDCGNDELFPRASLRGHRAGSGLLAEPARLRDFK
jgi:hypothetical protein